MGLISGYGATLRALREEAHLSREELAKRSGVAEGTLGRVEREVGPPNLETLAQILEPLGRTLVDFALALARQQGGETDLRAGVPRPDWVALLIRHGIDSRVLTGIAVSLVHDLRGLGDLVASAQEAAAVMARAAVREMLQAPSAQVAEPTDQYGAPSPMDRGAGRKARKGSPR